MRGKLAGLLLFFLPLNVSSLPANNSYANVCVFDIKRTGTGDSAPSRCGHSLAIGNCTSGVCGPVLHHQMAAGSLYLSFKPDQAICGAGMFLPLYPSEMLWSRSLRIILYGFSLVFCFLGVAIISDVFMAAIEVITSKEKVISYIDENGKPQERSYYVWNETVANLSLMALGSSAPEILLAVIETCGQLQSPPPPGGLGASTIVGSAAFNLLCITAVCVGAIPDNPDGTPGIRRIKSIWVFAVTAFFSVFAYVLLFLVVQDNVVTLTEALITLFLFPVLIFVAYSTEKGTCFGKKLHVKPSNSGQVFHLNADKEEFEGQVGTLVHEKRHSLILGALTKGQIDDIVHKLAMEMVMDAPPSRARYRINATRFLKGGKRVLVKKKNPPKCALATINEVHEIEVKDELTRQFTVCNKLTHRSTKVVLGAKHYVVHEGAGFVEIQVIRTGYLNCHNCVQWETKDGGAIAGEDYVHASGAIHFKAAKFGESIYGTEIHSIKIGIIDDDEYNPDKSFFVRLEMPPIDLCQRIMERQIKHQNKTKRRNSIQTHAEDSEARNSNISPIVSVDNPGVDNINDAVTPFGSLQVTKLDPINALKAQHPPICEDESNSWVDSDEHSLSNVKFNDYEFGPYSSAEVLILNDDTPGEFSFEKDAVLVREGATSVCLKIERSNGCDGKVNLIWKTVEMDTYDKNSSCSPAVSSVHYKAFDRSEIEFKHEQVEYNIEIPILANALNWYSTEEKNANDAERIKKKADGLEFIVELRLPNSSTDGSKFGQFKKCSVKIIRDSQYEEFMKELTERVITEVSKYRFDTSTWKEQFKAAMICEGEDDEEPGGIDYTMHFLTIGWKVLFALVPPTDYYGGWLAFLVSLAFIGLLTALVADIASTFGCLLGLPDAITAITFVALGTSLPDTFASKSAAANLEHADASVGNVTGSNSVNVFLGLGLPWTIATVIHTIAGYDDGVFRVEAGDLAFSVSVFCPCAVMCICIIFLRRLPFFSGAELGGSKFGVKITCSTLVGLWFLYILLSSLKSLNII